MHYCARVTGSLVAAGAVVCVCVLIFPAPVAAQRFERVESRGVGSRHGYVAATPDLNGDGLNDALIAEWALAQPEYQPEDRLTKGTVHEFVSLGNGRFRHAPRLVRGVIRARLPVLVVADFNGDTHDDVAVFDAGVYIGGIGGVGNPPQLFLNRPGRPHVRSHALARVVRREHRRNPPRELSDLADLHIKSATAGDIDNDGNVDLWVESTGGGNVDSHFLMNNGDGTFRVDTERAPYELLHNPPPENWRHHSGHLVDLDNDGDLDLALGQMRDLAPSHINQSSIVLVNHGAGYYLSRVILSLPRFSQGFTAVPGLTHFDVNDDGFQDLLLLHQRNDDGPPDLFPWTGRYIQVLINRGDLTFSDETRTWIGNQGNSRPQRLSDGSLLHGAATPVMRDINRDGCPDLLLTRNRAPVRRQTPLAYRNNGSGQFRRMAPAPFVGSDRDLGENAMQADVTGNGLTDIVFTTFDLRGTVMVALVNTTRPRAVRCR
ncbi:MAG: VCBS repeat-containing protein [Acidobacteria bacterium]|nr:VCBS repeat-containing protein [Acidobacteriota bacterium]